MSPEARAAIGQAITFLETGADYAWAAEAVLFPHQDAARWAYRRLEAGDNLAALKSLREVLESEGVADGIAKQIMAEGNGR